MRTYIVSRDIVINMFYPTWRVFTDDRTVSKLTATKNQLIEQGGILATKLCTHKENVNQINDIHLTRLPGEKKVFEATDSDSGMSAMLDSHVPVSYVLELKVGAQVTTSYIVQLCFTHLQNVKCNI